ncbi:MAG: hypothetical protein ACRD68_06305 [Pyrinomonadaceae bacterium]
MKHDKDVGKKVASTLTRAHIIDDEWIDDLKRRAEKLGLIIHQRPAPDAKRKREAGGKK